MAIALAIQSVVGNNVGAGLFQRSNAVLRLALVVSGLYCAIVEVGLLAGHEWIGRALVTDPDIILQVGEILRPMAAFYLFSGPVLVLALYFQAIGQPARTAALTLIKPFVLTPLLVAFSGIFWGARAIWYAFPLGDLVVIVIVIAVGLVIASRRHGTAAGSFGLSAWSETV